ncbi:MAG TPA: Ig-like domain-containing protein [Candidatus Limnocylindrales bacterium]
MRKVAAAALAVPVLAILYLPVLARRSIAARLVLLGTVGVVVAVAAFGLSRPAPITATPPAPPITALPDEAFRSISAGTDLRAGVTIHFSEAMDPTSVAAALSVEPQTSVQLAWSADATDLTIRPSSHWAAGTYHVLTVAPGALAASGRPMSAVARAAFVTRTGTSGRIEATQPAAGTTSVGTAFRLIFDHPVAADAVSEALRISPAVEGTLTAASGGDDTSAADPGSGTVFVFTPGASLAPGTAYRLVLDGLVDLDGAPVAVAEDLAVTTTQAPSVVRFRPANGASKVDRHATLSVRFTTSMDHSTTRGAFKVTANGKPVGGKIQFAESNTVLVFQPTSALPASATIVVGVGTGATSALHVPLAKPMTVTLHTVAAPKPKPKAPTTQRVTTTGHSSGGSGGSSGGKAVGGGSWGAVETYYLRLMNCTRTGGWVTSSGACSSPGGRSVAALRLDSGISSKVSRPYAKKLAVNNLCTHFSGGNPGNRLSAAGYHSYRWAENIGCRSSSPYSAVLASHLFFQAEKSSNGGHYVNLMNSAYDRVGIGVWVSGGRVRLVIDFYHP